MAHVTKIDHDVRRKMGITIGQFCVADAIHQHFKDGSAGVETLSKYLDIHEEHIKTMLESLMTKDFVKIAPRTGKMSVTSTWKNSSKVTKEIAAPSDGIVSKMRTEIEGRYPEYYWTAKCALNAKILSKKISFSFQKKYNRLPNQDDMFSSFLVILDNLPEFFVDKFDIALINSQFNNIISQIKASYVKRITNETGVGTEHHRSAAEYVIADHFRKSGDGVRESESGPGSNMQIGDGNNDAQYGLVTTQPDQ